MSTSILDNVSEGLNSDSTGLIIEIPSKKEELTIPINKNSEIFLKKVFYHEQASKNEKSVKDKIKSGFEELPSNENPKNDEIVLEFESTIKEPEVLNTPLNTEFVLQKVLCPVEVNHNEGSVKESINTGFSFEESLDYKPCSDLPLSLPLYKENFLSEFFTDEDKKTARRNLGIYTNSDVVELGLLTVEDLVTDINILDTLKIKVLQSGASPVAVQTTASAVLVKETNGYSPLQTVLQKYNTLVQNTNSKIDTLLNKSSEGSKINTVGDIKSFLTGFTNTESLVEVLEDYLKFESKGTIEQTKWQI